MELIGQKIINEKLNNLNIDNMPSSLLLCGLRGCGKHTVVKEIGNKLQLPVKDISLNLTNDFLDTIYVSTQPAVYLIDIDRLISDNKRIIRNENVILKILEEPPKSAYIIILCQRLSQVITTVKNRCQIWEFEVYDRETLNKFLEVPDPAVSSIANTPGKVLEYVNYPISEIAEVCKKVVTKGCTTLISNLLIVSDMLNYDDATWNAEDKYKKGSIVSYQSKRYEALSDNVNIVPTDRSCWRQSGVSYNFECMLEILLMVAKNQIITDTDPKYYKIYQLTDKLFNNQFIANIDRKTLFEHYLCSLKEI